jgi:hypothetical protein
MLTDIALKALKPAAKPYKQADGGGLFVLVQPSGRKSWRIAFRVEKKQKFLSGGTYPDVSLRDARAGRAAVKAQLTLGIDPTVEPLVKTKKLAETKEPVAKPDRNSFEAVAREWFKTRLLGWTPRYAGVLMRRLEGDIFPLLGKEPISAITPRQMLEALRAIEQRGSIEMAHRVKNHCSEVFRYAIPDGRCESDPCRDLGPAMARPKPVKHRAKIPAKELSAFFDKLNADNGARASTCFDKRPLSGNHLMANMETPT